MVVQQVLIKHLFNVPGIVFIFSLDLTQLQHCVKTVYGNEFDAVGYLERFFDYTSLLPHGDENQLFKNTMDEFGLNSASLNRETYLSICREFSLSIREIRAVCSSFFYLEKYELEGYPLVAKQLYFYLIALKYKEPVKVHEALTNREDSKAIREELMKKYPPIFSPCLNGIEPFKLAFVENQVIANKKDYYVVQYDVGTYDESITFHIDFYSPPCARCNDRPDYIEQLTNNCLSYAIFNKDFASPQLFNFRLLDYLYRKVELYDSRIEATELDTSKAL